MNRVQKKIKYLDRTWNLSSIVPADFICLSFWPFSFYRLSEEQVFKKQEIKRDWKLKPKSAITDEEKLSRSIKHVFKIGLGINSDSEYKEIKKDETLYSILLAEIYAISYQLTSEEKLFIPFEFYSREFCEMLAIKSKALHVEPFSFLKDISKEKPELFNPKRYDFNWLVLSTGWEREQREAEVKSRLNMKVR
jgi:hypothetical protein